MAEETIFSKIIRREIPSDVVYQDELVTAFRDISPQAPTHILIVPNILIPTVNDVTAEHELALGRMMTGISGCEPHPASNVTARSAPKWAARMARDALSATGRTLPFPGTATKPA